LPECHVSATFRRNLLLVVKEALANAMKHSAATKIRVSFDFERSHVLVRIEDNGSGFDPAEKRAKGNGLVNIHRRTTDLGGEIEICSSRGQGTSLKIRVPLPREL